MKNVYLTRIPPVQSPPASFGILLVDLREGVIVVAQLVEGGLAERDGRLKVGDCIVTVNGKRLKDSVEALALSLSADTVLIQAYTPPTGPRAVLI